MNTSRWTKVGGGAAASGTTAGVAYCYKNDAGESDDNEAFMSGFMCHDAAGQARTSISSNLVYVDIWPGSYCSDNCVKKANFPKAIRATEHQGEGDKEHTFTALLYKNCRPAAGGSGQ